MLSNSRRASKVLSRHLTIVLPLADYRVYASAARKLRCSLGRKAPDVLILIQHELSNRDVNLIVDDYLHACARRRAPTRPGAGGTSSHPPEWRKSA